MKLTDPRLRSVSKSFHSLVLDPRRAIDMRQLRSLEIPVDWSALLPAEDIYLIETYLTVDADKLVTTDRLLFESLGDLAAVTCQMRDEFLSQYLL